MAEDSEHKKLVELVRKIAREEVSIALDEHLEDYEHKEKPASEEVLDHE